jgi:hypothetical protein
VAIVEMLRSAGAFSASDLAATPAGIAAGKLWLLVTSAFAVSGPPVLELCGVAAAALVLVRRRDAWTFWVVAIMSHVGATLLAYAGVGLVWLGDRGAVESVVDRLDYGVSAVWLGVLGALFADSVQSLRRRGGDRLDRMLVVVCPIAAVIGFAFFPLLPGSEHLIAFFLGALVATLPAKRGRLRSRV